jgi:hypothetical protein
VKNLRFTQSYVQALADVEAVGRDATTLIDELFGALRVPALKIRRFTFYGKHRIGARPSPPMRSLRWYRYAAAMLMTNTLARCRTPAVYFSSPRHR